MNRKETTKLLKQMGWKELTTTKTFDKLWTNLKHPVTGAMIGLNDDTKFLDVVVGLQIQAEARGKEKGKKLIIDKFKKLMDI